MLLVGLIPLAFHLLQIFFALLVIIIIFFLKNIIAHDCELNFVDIANAASKTKGKAEKVFYKGNPFLSGIFVNENAFVACGYDKVPYLFKKTNSGWEFVKILDEGITQVK